MREVAAEQVSAALRAVGLQRGDGVLAHSALQFLGQPAGGIDLYLQALDEVIGCLPPEPAGTLAVPTFNFAFAKGEPYDPQTTPAAGMGSFSEYVRQRPEAMRTSHPMQSLAVVGRYAADLTGRDTPSAFDPGSAFDRMVALDFKLLLLGASVQAVSLLHLCEQRVGVPYRYWKEFSGPVRTPAGWQERSYRMYVRDLQLDPHLTLAPVQAMLEQRGQWRSVPVNYGQIAAVRMADFVAAVDEFLERDPWSLMIRS